jgi:hypothetical protein
VKRQKRESGDCTQCPVTTARAIVDIRGKAFQAVPYGSICSGVEKMQIGPGKEKHEPGKVTLVLALCSLGLPPKFLGHSTTVRVDIVHQSPNPLKQNVLVLIGGKVNAITIFISLMLDILEIMMQALLTRKADAFVSYLPVLVASIRRLLSRDTSCS